MQRFKQKWHHSTTILDEEVLQTRAMNLYPLQPLALLTTQILFAQECFNSQAVAAVVGNKYSALNCTVHAALGVCLCDNGAWSALPMLPSHNQDDRDGNGTVVEVNVYVQRHALSCANILQNTACGPEGKDRGHIMRTAFATDTLLADGGTMQSADARSWAMGGAVLPNFHFAGSSHMRRAMETALVFLPKGNVEGGVLHAVPFINEDGLFDYL